VHEMNDYDRAPLLPLSVLYLLLPALLFAAGWLRPGVAAAVGIVLVAFAMLLLRDLAGSLRQGQDRMAAGAGSRGGAFAWRSTWPGVLVILIWVLLSGAGGFGYQHRDHKASNALLRDLIEEPWPLTVSTGAGQEKVVYYLAYFLPAAALGKVAGWGAANVALFLWTLLGTLLAFGWFLRMSRRDGREAGPRPILLAALFCGAGGLDLIGARFFQNSAIAFSSENEWWAGYFQYSSNTTLLYWVPQQAIAAWLATGLICDAARNRDTWRYVAVTLAALVLWTPFGLVGVLPFLGLSLLEALWRGDGPPRGLRVWVLTVAGFLLGAVHALYIASNSLRFPAGVLWTIVDDRLVYLKYVAAFWMLEFALLVVLFFAGAATERRRPALVDQKSVPGVGSAPLDGGSRTGLSDLDLRRLLVALLVLLVLPGFTLGYYNALAMRTSIPALFVLWISAARLVGASSAPRARTMRIIQGLVVAILIVGMYPAAVNVHESLAAYHFGPPDLSGVLTTATVNRSQIVALRFGDSNAFFYRYLGR